jgi:deoxyribodipyrimidine photo-lyase
MIESLKDLKKKIKFNVFIGDVSKVVGSIYKDIKFNSIWMSKSYDKHLRDRANRLRSMGWKVHEVDSLMYTPSEAPTKVFSAYLNHVKVPSKPIKASTSKVKDMSKLPNVVRASTNLSDITKDANMDKVGTSIIKGGRSAALKLLKSRIPLMKDYVNRDQLGADNKSHLSAYLNFGCISPREVYWFAKKRLSRESFSVFARELYYRDFFCNASLDIDLFIDTAEVVGAKKWKSMTEAKEVKYREWCKGKTGVDIVDAGMRQLLATGYMHNRARMITASWLIHDIGCDWRFGEEWFARNLTDYDYAVNRANWIWVAGLYFNRRKNTIRFNPDTQSHKYDKDHSYRDKWLKLDK